MDLLNTYGYTYLLDNGIWQLSPNKLPATMAYHTSIVNNNYVYAFGGARPVGTNFEILDTVYYALLDKTTGSVGVWETSKNKLPGKTGGGTSIVNNNFAYVLGGVDAGGSNTNNPVNTVYYAPLNKTTGSVGVWKTSIHPLTNKSLGHTSIVNNNFVYVMGGNSGDTGTNSKILFDTVYYAPLNKTTGENGEWILSPNLLPEKVTGGSSVVYNNFVYIIGGNSGNKVYYAPIDKTNGSVGVWNTSIFPIEIKEESLSIVNNNFIYVMTSDKVYYTMVDMTNGSLGEWKIFTTLPKQLGAASSIVNNNFIYLMGGGYEDANKNRISTDTVYYLNIFPSSNICFPKGTPINTDQGMIMIDQINPDLHTINKKLIVDITKTITMDNYLVEFRKNSLGINCPSEKTTMSLYHKVYYRGKMYEAKTFLGKFDKVRKVRYTGEILYNVLMEDYSEMIVNNLTCETLHPDNIIAKLYTKKCKYTYEVRDKIYMLLKECLQIEDYKTYNHIIQCC